MEEYNRKKLKIISAVMLIVFLFLIFGGVPIFTKDRTLYADSFEFYGSNLPDEEPSYPTSHDGRTFYVAEKGVKDLNAGRTPDNPLCLEAIRWFTRPTVTMQEPSHLFQPGDQILLKRGDVFETNLEIHFCNGTVDNPITIGSYGDSDKRPLIEIAYGVEGILDLANNGVGAVIIHECSNIVVRDLEINVKWLERKEANKLLSAGSGIIVGYDEVGNEKYENVYIVNNVIHGECINSDNPFEANTFGIRINSYEQSYESSPDDYPITGIYVTGNEIYNIGRSGISVQGWIQKEGMSQMKFTIFKDVHLDNNIVHDAGTIGIYAGAATGCTMNRNLVYNMGMYECEEGEDPQEGEGGLMSICLKDSEIKYNITYNNYRQGIINDGIGIDIDWNSWNIVVQYNYVYACDGSGIGTMSNYQCKILNNRVVDNRAITNHPGQISLCGFVPWGDNEKEVMARYLIAKNDPSLLVIRDIEIADNLIAGTPKNNTGVNPDFPKKSLFCARKTNGEGDWYGNSFHDNHLIYKGDDTDFYYILINDDSDSDGKDSQVVCLDKFYNNKYYAKSLQSFNCIDDTIMTGTINAGATLVPSCSTFSEWKKRDLLSTFEFYNPNAKKLKKPDGANVTFKNDKLNISWLDLGVGVWHYNIYKVAEGEEPTYRNMLGETKSTAFSYSPKSKGEFYIVIEPENNLGECGEQLWVKVKLN